jgi:hypothetical protein
MWRGIDPLARKSPAIAGRRSLWRTMTRANRFRRGRPLAPTHAKRVRLEAAAARRRPAYSFRISAGDARIVPTVGRVIRTPQDAMSGVRQG